MSDFSLINKAAHRIYPTHLKEHEKGSSFSWSGVLPTDAKLRLGDSEGHKQTDDRNSHTLTHKLKGGASIEFNIVQNGKNHIAMAKYHKGGKLFTAIHAHEDPSKAIKTAYDSVARRIVTEEAEIALIEKMEKRIEKKTGKLSDKKEKIDVEPTEEKELKEATPPGMESWVKKNKAHFIKEYGEKKGHEVLYATAWKLHNKMNEMEELDEIAFQKGDHVVVNSGDGSPWTGRISRVGKGREGYAAPTTYAQLHSIKPDKEYQDRRGSKTVLVHPRNVELHEAELKEGTIEVIPHFIGVMPDGRKVSPFSAGVHHVEKTGKWTWGVTDHNGNYTTGMSRKPVESKEEAIRIAHEVAAKTRHKVKLSESTHTYTKESLAKQIKYHEDRAAHHDSEAQASFNKAQDLTGDKADLHFNAAKGHKAIADLHRKHIYDLKSSAGLTEAAGKVEMMYLSKGFISPELAEKLARESKHLGTDKSTGEQHYLHPQHGRMALVPHKPSGQFQFRLAEEIEQLDELSPHTLGMYTKIASIDMAHHRAQGALSHRAQIDADSRGSQESAKAHEDNKIQHDKKATKRLNGIIKATDKLVHKAVVKEEQLEETRVAPHPDKIVMTSSIRKDLGGGYMAKTRNGHFYKLDVNAFGEPGKGRELPKLGAVLDTSKHKFIGKGKVDLNLLKEHIGNETDGLKNYIHTHPILGRFNGKEEKYNHKEDGEVRAFHEPNGKHVLVYSKKTTPYGATHKATIYYKRAENEPMLPQTRKFVGHEPDHVLHAVAHEFTPIKEDLDHNHPDMKVYHAAVKASDEAHLKSIRYRLNHDIKQPEHRAKYDELEAEHHRLRDIEDQASEKVHGRLFAHHAGFKE